MQIAAYRIPTPTTPRTVAWMSHFIRSAGSQMKIRELAERIVARLTAKDYVGEGVAVARWVEANTRYTRDPRSVELVKHPVEALRMPRLDCDEQSALIGGLLMSIGHRCALVTGDFGDGWSHVFVQIQDPKSGKWVVLDPVAQPDVKGMLRRVRRFRVYPV